MNLNMPSLSGQEQDQALTELRKRFPRASDEQLQGFLKGRTPSMPGRTESTGGNPAALQNCLALVNDNYEAAVKAAQDAKPDWFKGCLLAAALAARFFGQLECYDENS
jgi:hypothetical protein